MMLLLLAMLHVIIAHGQQPVNINYQDKPLFEVLNDLEKKYQVRFSYVQDKLDLDKNVNFYVKQRNLEQALKSLFDQHNILYSNMGQHWVLKSSKKPNVITSFKTIVPQKEIPTPISINDSVATKKAEELAPIVLSNILLEPISQREISIDVPRNIAIERSIKQNLRIDLNQLLHTWKERRNSGDIKVFQFSTFGNRKRYSNKTNIISLSLVWGIHGSSEGIQIAGMGSVVRRDVFGLQLSGVFNAAGADVFGFQAAGIMNSTKKTMTGLQVAGVHNYAAKAIGVQISLGLNKIKNNIRGVQIGGIANIVGKSSNAVQIASVSNFTRDSAHIQISGLYNKAGTVRGFQLGTGINETDYLLGAQIGMVNRAKCVKGLQLGFINFADSVSGVSLGLLNIVKAGGYNKLDASFGESMHVMMSLKIGSKSMYQIYQGGFTLRGNAWGLGWGLGSVFELNKKWLLNSELSSMHINEDNKWNRTLNLLNQLRVGFEYKLDKDFSLYLGPNFNIMVSRYKAPETGMIGSAIPFYTFFERTNDRGTNIRMWIGVQTGVRMRLW